MKIVHYPHPALRHVARPISTIDKKIHLAVGEMFDLMYDAHGLGLAATQVALPYQLLVMNVSGDSDDKASEHVFVNPVIIERKGHQEGNEGCLSFPELFQKVRRAKTVKVEAYSLQGEKVQIVASDLEARAWQHEIDHLNGVLFIDKMGMIARMAARGDIALFEEEFRRAQEKGEIPPATKIEEVLAALAAEA